MNSDLWFLIGCIPARLLLAGLVYKYHSKYSRIMALVLAAIGISFLYLYFANKRLDAPEANGHTWWAKYRIYHGILYLAAAVLLLVKPNYAFIPLLADVTLGVYLKYTKKN